MKSKKIFRNAFTVIEMLMALVIAAMLMTALAAAFNASMVNYKTNEDAFKVTNTARQALNRITTELRTAKAVAVSESSYRCSMITAENRIIAYIYNSPDNTLYLSTLDDFSDDNYILATGVTAMTFTRATYPSDPGKIRNVQISMTVSDNNFTKTLSTAAVIRKNLP